MVRPDRLHSRSWPVVLSSEPTDVPEGEEHEAEAEGEIMKALPNHRAGGVVAQAISATFPSTPTQASLVARLCLTAQATKRFSVRHGQRDGSGHINARPS
jgi:hypothetical protein